MGSSLLLVMGLLAAAQATHATVAGVVRDGASGEPLAGAIVTLADIDRGVTSDSLGRYRFTGVPAGPQHLAVRRLGYAPRTLHALVPTSGALGIDIALRREPRLMRTVEVRPKIEIRGLDDGDSATFPDRSISLAGIRHHPMLTEPDVLLALGGGEIAMRPELPSGVHLRGGASDQTAFLIDGIPVLNPYHAAGTFSAWNPDAIDRMRVSSAMPGPQPAHVLAGVIAAETRTPGSQVRAAGSLGSAQARVAVDGPVGDVGGFLIALRTNFPGALRPTREPSYVHGVAGDLLAKLEAPLAGGRALILAYASDNALDVAAGESDARASGMRNDFGWRSRSAGAEWSRDLGDAEIRVRGWSALGDANATWFARGDAATRLAAHRHDLGVLASVERRAAGATTRAGVSIQQSATSYGTLRSDAQGKWTLRARTPTTSGFVHVHRALRPHLTADASFSATATAGGIFLSPGLRLRWTLSPELVLTGSVDRAHQYAQSLRNSESIVGVVFPADLFVGANAPGVPVARADRLVLAAELRPGAATRVGAQAYWRVLDDVLLVAPSTGEPFAAGDFATGSGTAHGFAFDAAVSGARYGVVASYGWQDVRLRRAGGTYTPEFAARHQVEAGVIVHPVATASIRAGVTGVLGRRATAIGGVLEWEACNLLDWGCEFGGSPRHMNDLVGMTRLPGYLRLDLGVRKHWHVRMAGRDAQVAVFGAVTNLLGRRNVMAIAVEPMNGELAEIGMRPLAPLVVGVDWRF